MCAVLSYSILLLLIIFTIFRAWMDAQVDATALAVAKGKTRIT